MAGKIKKAPPKQEKPMSDHQRYVRARMDASAKTEAAPKPRAKKCIPKFVEESELNFAQSQVNDRLYVLTEQLQKTQAHAVQMFELIKGLTAVVTTLVSGGKPQPGVPTSAAPDASPQAKYQQKLRAVALRIGYDFTSSDSLSHHLRDLLNLQPTDAPPVLHPATAIALFVYKMMRLQIVHPDTFGTAVFGRLWSFDDDLDDAADLDE